MLLSSDTHELTFFSFVILFYVILKNGKTMQASEITYLLNSKLKHDVDFLEFKFIRAETFGKYGSKQFPIIR